MAKKKPSPNAKPSPIQRLEPKRVEIALVALTLSRELQPRVRLNPEVVAEYADIYRHGGPNAMEPIRAYATPDGDPILTRGYTRVAAAKEAGLTTLPCDLYPEPPEDFDLILDSLSGNKHGQKLTNADKHRALELYHSKIDVKLWGSTREVSMLLGCSHDLVADYRKKLSAPAIEEPTEPEQAQKPETNPEKPQPSKSQPIDPFTPEEIKSLSLSLCANIKNLTMEEAVLLSVLWDLQAFPGATALIVVTKNIMEQQGTVFDDFEDFIELIEDFRQSCYIESEGDEVIWLTEEGQKEILRVLSKCPLPPPGHSQTKEPKTEPTHKIPNKTEEPAKPKHKPGSTLDKAREILADRIVEEPMRAFRLPGRQREIYLLAVIVGIDSNGLFEWTDDNLDEAELAFAQGLAKRTAQELKRGNECIGTLSSIARIWDLDPNAIMILAERATK